MTVDIRLDSAGLQEVAVHLMSCDASFHPPLSTRVDLASYAGKLVQDATRFEAWSGGRLIGLVAVYCNASDRGTAFVSNVSVDPHHRGQGVARRLMRECITHLRHLGFERAALQVDQSALSAIGLYQSMGFRAPGDAASAPLRMMMDLGPAE